MGLLPERKTASGGLCGGPRTENGEGLVGGYRAVQRGDSGVCERMTDGGCIDVDVCESTWVPRIT